MGLYVSVSIRRAESSVVSVPVQGWAVAICWVPLPALDYATLDRRLSTRDQDSHGHIDLSKRRWILTSKLAVLNPGLQTLL